VAEKVENLPVSGSLPHPAHRERYPWQARAWTALTQSFGRLPHAILLHGPAGLGKAAFAWRLAQALICTQSGADANACGQCYSCRLFAAGTHPDLLSVRPLEDSATIMVDQVREVRDFLSLKPHTATHKLVLLMPAEAMNINAANALLKVLEEPPARAVLLLVTAQPLRLPATIRSRCTATAFRAPPLADTARWLQQQGAAGDLPTILQQTGGAPLRALEAARTSMAAEYEQLRKDAEALRLGRDEPLRCAVRWKDIGAAVCLEWFQRYLTELIRAQMMELNDRRIESKSLQLNDLFYYLDVLTEAKNQLNGPLDPLLLLEDVLIRWHRVARRMD
jgi:DNA polymerase III subunit delta'